MPSPRKSRSWRQLDELDPVIRETYEKLGIPIAEQEVLAGVKGARKVAVDAVFDSVSVATTFREELESAGVIFMSISEAIKEHPELVKKHLGKVVPMRDNYFATLNCAVFSPTARLFTSPRAFAARWSFPPISGSTPKIPGSLNALSSSLMKAAMSAISKAAPRRMRDENQLHAAVVELVALDDAEIKYSTVQNWYPGDEEGKGGIYNFVTKRGLCQGKNSKISWTQVETGSAITWKYPSCVLNGENSVGEFYSVALTNNYQQADTGTKMIHNGKNTPQHNHLQGHQRRQDRITAIAVWSGSARMPKMSATSRNVIRLLLGDQCGAHTVPYIEVKNPTAQIEHEATTSRKFPTTKCSTPSNAGSTKKLR